MTVLSPKFSCLLLALALMIMQSCRPAQDKQEEVSLNNDTQISLPKTTLGLSSKELAVAYCGACHLFPEPDLLTKEIWLKGIMPNMGARLGIRDSSYNPFEGLSLYESSKIDRANIYPRTPLISREDMQRIKDFFQNESPENILPQDLKIKPDISLKHFIPRIQNYNPTGPALTTLLKYDSASSLLFIGEASNQLNILDDELSLIKTYDIDSPAPYVKVSNTGFYLLTMGIMNPTEMSIGKFYHFETPENKLADSDSTRRILIDNLSRPVHVSFADLNQDNLEDVIICNFGNLLGDLSWYEADKEGKYKKHILKSLPGAIKTEVFDFDRDGLSDIIALMGQGNEGLFVFYNQGKGNFKEDNILRFPPVYGSNSFELVDFNNDGWMDILYTNGDNGDNSFSLKKYHGIRLFINNGENNFEEKYFYPLNGASKAMAHDFDMDGDYDIAAISFFPDYEGAPLEGFIYLENNGLYSFKASTFPEAIEGRWLVMEKGDFDKDNDTDLILGSFIYGVTPVPKDIQNTWADKPHVILLENKTID